MTVLVLRLAAARFRAQARAAAAAGDNAAAKRLRACASACDRRAWAVENPMDAAVASW